jgi:hypothetical protein
MPLSGGYSQGFTGAIYYRDLLDRVHHQNRAAGEKLKRSHMAIDPGMQILPLSGKGEGVTAGAKRSNKD